MNAQIVRLYDTVFDRAPDAEGLEFWNNATHDGGLGLRDLANFFIAAPEFAAIYGEPTVQGFVESLYQNILDRPGEAEGIAFWTNALDSGLADRAQVVVGFSESAEHIQQMATPVPAPAPDFGALDMTALPETRPGPYETEPHPHTGVVPPKSFYTHSDNATIVGGAGSDHMFAVSHRGVTLWGQGGDDILQGGPGDDVLHGGPGDDILHGGGSKDTMVGGPGADLFVYTSVPHVETFGLTINEINGDTIVGFEVGADLLDFRALQLVFRGQDAFGANGQAQLRYEDHFTPRAEAGAHVPGSTLIFLDVNGDGTADARMQVAHVPLTDAHFLI